jgi:hypothetical protein
MGTKGSETTKVMIDLESPIEARPGDIVCTADERQILFLRPAATLSSSISLLNTHTYNQADFDAVREVLLCPRPLGLLAMRGPALSALRAVFGNRLPTRYDPAMWEELCIPVFDGPSCVTFHPFYPGGESCVIQNFNASLVNVTVTVPVQNGQPSGFVERFARKPVATRSAESKGTAALDIPIPARGRVWIQRVDGDAAD